MVGLGGWFAYDGFLNKGFMAEHTDEEGKPEFVLWFNQKSPPFFLAGAFLFGVRLFMVRNRRIVAEEDELVIDSRVRIPYGSVQEIDKTHFETKGVFTVVYDAPGGKRTRRKIDCRDYENMGAILDHLVAQIS